MQNEILQELRRNSKKRGYLILSMDVAAFEDSEGHEITYADLIPCDEKGYGELESRDWIDSLRKTDALSGREKKIFNMMLSGYSQTDIQRVVGISQSYVSRLIRGSIRKLQKQNLLI